MRKLSASKPANSRDFTKGAIIGNLVRLSWPMIISQTAAVLGPVIDMIWVGRLGPASVAAVATGGIVIGLAITIIMGFVTGARALIARSIGAGDHTGAIHVSQQSLAVSLAFSILMALLGVFFSETILNLIGLDEEVITEGKVFMQLMFIGTAPTSFRMMAEAIMQVSGDTINPMRISIVYIVLRIVVAPLLIYGNDILSWWILPGIGINGSAVAMIVAHGLTMAVLLWMLFTGRSRLHLTLRNFRIDLTVIWRIVKIGFPALISMAQRNLAQLVLIRFMAPFGTVAVAAHGIAQRVEMLVMTPVWALGMGAGVLVGQNLGAKQPKRAEKSSWLAVGISEVFTVACSLALFLWPEIVVRIFNTAPDLIATASVYLRIAAAGYLILGLWLIFYQSLNGAGDTVPAMVFSLIATWAVTMPVAYMLPRFTGMGAAGVRWGMAIGMVAAGILYPVYFLTGKWKQRRV